MPLLDTDFDQKFVPVTEDLTVDEALDALKAQDGEDDWHFFVDRPDVLVGVIKVSQLKEYLAELGPALFGLTFGQLRPRVPAGRTAQQDKIGIGMAEEWALADPQGVLIVMRGDRFAGRLYRGARRGNDDPFPASTMGQLYGEYINTNPDARSELRPAGIDFPTCPNCGHQDFFRYRAVDGASYCDNCGETIAEGD
jgi:hypothetical protein